VAAIGGTGGTKARLEFLIDARKVKGKKGMPTEQSPEDKPEGEKPAEGGEGDADKPAE
jgi:hypothetical protein